LLMANSETIWLIRIEQTKAPVFWGFLVFIF
jgi:hypothetical protein